MRSEHEGTNVFFFFLKWQVLLTTTILEISANTKRVFVEFIKSVFARQRKECQITSVRDRERQDRRGRNKVVFKGKGCSVTSDELET